MNVISDVMKVSEAFGLRDRLRRTLAEKKTVRTNITYGTATMEEIAYLHADSDSKLRSVVWPVL